MSPMLPFGTPYTPNMGSVDLDRLTGTSEGITLFMVIGSSWWNLGMSQDKEATGAPAMTSGRGSPVVDQLVRRTTNLMINGRMESPTGQHKYPGPPTALPSPTPIAGNPNGSNFSSSSTPTLSPLGNRAIHRVIQLPSSSSHSQPVVCHPRDVTDARPLDSMVRRVRFHL
jgi:hypothetical protein